MTYSSKTLIIGQIIYFCLNILGVLIISKLIDTQKEEKIVLKLFGYTLITAFRLKVNGIYIPLGPVIAFLLIKKSSKNQKAKLSSIVLGIVLIFYPYKLTLNKIEQSLYPRNNIRTYLVGERTHGGVAVIFYTKDGTSLKAYTANLLDNDLEAADMIYNELINCEISRDDFMVEHEYIFRFNQEIEDPRFGRLVFKVSKDAKLLQLEFEKDNYIFKTTEKFQKLFMENVNNS